VISKKPGDGLFLSSIVAVNADTGAYVWHYQTTPGDSWDFDSDQQLVLADLKIGGTLRHVVMQAPKNGFFYVLDRATGELISAKNFVPVNWATGIDMKTGRPIENPAARYGATGKTFMSTVGAYGAHNWQPMAFSPVTGFVYIPAQEFPFPYTADAAFKPGNTGYNVALNVAAGSLPQVPAIKAAVRATLKGELLAWDPVAEKEAWRVQYAGPWNGGVLATAGNLVLQGNAGGHFQAFRADNGVKVWSTPAQTGIIAAPMTYEAGGTQYIAVMAGWGGAMPLAAGELAFKSGHITNISRLLVYKLGGGEHLPPMPEQAADVLNPPPLVNAGPAVIKAGFVTYEHYCSVCHGDAAVSGGPVPDLRHSGALADEATFRGIVIGGALKAGGMASFKGTLDDAQVDAVRDYLISRAQQDKLAAAKE
jgi:alcohol dehydrogenase (cytochrome c)/quinohemoprotein ethanol dehydrogenase